LLSIFRKFAHKIGKDSMMKADKTGKEATR